MGSGFSRERMHKLSQSSLQKKLSENSLRREWRALEEQIHVQGETDIETRQQRSQESRTGVKLLQLPEQRELVQKWKLLLVPRE